MSPAEILHRFREQGLRLTGKNVSLDEGNLGSLDALPFSQAEFQVVSNACVEAWQEEVARATAGQWRYIGQDWPSVDLDDLWHFDPVSGAEWEKNLYCFDVPYRNRLDRGDIKFTWEVNRLQVLPVAAALFRAQGRPEDRAICLRIMESWIDANPPFLGVNWNSGIEIALRIMSFTTAISLLDLEEIPPALQAKIVLSLHAHLLWLNRFPSKYSSANNHLIAELAATYVLGRLMPKLPNAEAFSSKAFIALGDQALAQIHQDGVGAEQSPTYACFTLEWILLALNTAKRAGDTFDPQVFQRLQASAHHLRWMMDEGGNVPRIGDDDEGRVILSGASREEGYVSSVLSSLAVSADCQEFAPPFPRPHLRHLWTGMAGPAGPSPKGAHFFDAGGYSVLRHAGKERTSMIALDHGPLGFLSIAAHGHADALSVWWHIEDQPVFVDAGTYLYHSGGELRDQFRGTALHNTLCLSGADQSKVSGAFNWSHKAKSYRLPMAKTELGLCSVGRHDGYRKRFGVIHERKLALDTPAGYVINDRLIGKPKEGCNEAILNFVLHPNVSAIRNADGQVYLSLSGKRFAKIKLKLRNDEALRRAGEAVPLYLEDVPYSSAFGIKSTTTAIRARVSTRDLTTKILETRIVIDGK